MAQYKVEFTYKTYVDEVSTKEEAIQSAYDDFQKNFNKSNVKVELICE